MTPRRGCTIRHGMGSTRRLRWCLAWLLVVGSAAPLAAGIVPGFGPFAATVPLPADPGLVGATVHLQGVAAKGSKVRLTNLASLTLQP